MTQSVKNMTPEEIAKQKAYLEAELEKLNKINVSPTNAEMPTIPLMTAPPSPVDSNGTSVHPADELPFHTNQASHLTVQPANKAEVADFNAAVAKKKIIYLPIDEDTPPHDRPLTPTPSPAPAIARLERPESIASNNDATTPVEKPFGFFTPMFWTLWLTLLIWGGIFAFGYIKASLSIGQQFTVMLAIPLVPLIFWLVRKFFKWINQNPNFDMEDDIETSVGLWVWVIFVSALFLSACLIYIWNVKSLIGNTYFPGLLHLSILTVVAVSVVYAVYRLVAWKINWVLYVAIVIGFLGVLLTNFWKYSPNQILKHLTIGDIPGAGAIWDKSYIKKAPFGSLWSIDVDWKTMSTWLQTSPTNTPNKAQKKQASPSNQCQQYTTFVYKSSKVALVFRTNNNLPATYRSIIIKNPDDDTWESAKAVEVAIKSINRVLKTNYKKFVDNADDYTPDKSNNHPAYVTFKLKSSQAVTTQGWFNKNKFVTSDQKSDYKHELAVPIYWTRCPQ